MKPYAPCFALLSISCLTPPGYMKAAAPASTTAAAAVPVSLGDFSRTSPELLATLRPGWNLGQQPRRARGRDQVG